MRALIVYFCLGLPLAARVAPRPLAGLLAPAFGWAVHSVIALPLLFVFGMSRPAVIAVFAVPLIAAAVRNMARPPAAPPIASLCRARQP